MRIVSLLPAATEILYAIGAGDSVVGVTHECDYPAQASRKPVLIRSRIDNSAPPAEIDRQVREIIERGESIYAVDGDLLAQLEPDLIVTQDLCHVCAASPEDLTAALARLPNRIQARVVSFTPRILDEVWQGVHEIGAAAERAEPADQLAAKLRVSVTRIADVCVAFAARPRVLCLEWFDPPYCGGHWVPEMVRLAGGEDVLGREGTPSVPIEWQQIVSAQPEVIVLMPCGYNLARNLEVWRSTVLPPEWTDLPAVRAGRVFAVDGNAYFSRCGPRLADGIALLAQLFHGEQALKSVGPYVHVPSVKAESVRVAVTAG